eukprot:SAG11_NODE_1651_length_4509_cov_3.919274_3_plen_129_part_00
MACGRTFVFVFRLHQLRVEVGSHRPDAWRARWLRLVLRVAVSLDEVQPSVDHLHMVKRWEEGREAWRREEEDRPIERWREEEGRGGEAEERGGEGRIHRLVAHTSSLSHSPFFKQLNLRVSMSMLICT